MDQQSIVLYLFRNGLSPVAIHDDRVATLGAEAVSYPSVTRIVSVRDDRISNGVRCQILGSK
jgi:hypothetical protein